MELMLVEQLVEWMADLMVGKWGLVLVALKATQLVDWKEYWMVVQRVDLKAE